VSAENGGSELITGKMKFRLPKLSVSAKALKNVVKKIAKEVKAEMRDMVPRLTGALRMSIGEKVVGKRAKAKAIVGVKAHYVKYKKVKKTGEVEMYVPNLYAMKIERQTHFLANKCGPDLVNRLTAAWRQETQRLTEESFKQG